MSAFAGKRHMAQQLSVSQGACKQGQGSACVTVEKLLAEYSSAVFMKGKVERSGGSSPKDRCGWVPGLSIRDAMRPQSANGGLQGKQDLQQT